MRRAWQHEFIFRTWGGRRLGAGRPPTARRRPVPHRSRAPHHSSTPVHVTIRIAADLPSLRDARLFATVRSALAASSHACFRLLQFSVQADHVHLLVEADHREGLIRGCQGFSVRVAKAEPCAWPSWSGLWRSLSRASAEHSARIPKRSRVRAQQLDEARPRRVRTRSTVVRGLVRRVADSPSTPGGSGTSGSAANVARTDGVASPRPARSC